MNQFSRGQANAITTKVFENWLVKNPFHECSDSIFLVEWKPSRKKVHKMVPRETVKSIGKEVKRLFFWVPTRKNNKLYGPPWIQSIAFGK